jgi:hypothetical protein
MAIDVTRIGTALPTPDASKAVVSHPGGDGFAAVYDLSAKRAQLSRPQIPEEIWDEVDAASRSADEMSRSGHALRFDVHRIDGRVMASLCNSDGEVVRPVSLSEVLDVGSAGPEAAA